MASKSGAIVISHDVNSGKGAALKSLLVLASEMDADVVVTVDGDGQFRVSDMPKLMKPIIMDDADLVIGSRFHCPNEMPLYRRMGNKILSQIACAGLAKKKFDTQSGYRAYSSKFKHLLAGVSDGYAADSEILFNAIALGYRVTEIPVSVLYNTGYATSKHDIVTQGIEVLEASLSEMLRHNFSPRRLGKRSSVIVGNGMRSHLPMRRDDQT